MEEQQYRFIHELSESEYIELYRIMSNPDVTQWLSDGRPWTPNKLLNLREFSAKDFTRPWNERNYFYWAIIARGHVVGIIGLHPSLAQISPGLQIMFAIKPSERGKHRASRAIRDIMNLENVRKDAREIVAIVRPDNAPSMKTLASTGVFKEDTVATTHAGAKFIVFRRTL